MNIRQNIAQEALSWLGTPYHHHGRIKGVGVDCAQLLCGVYEAVGLVPHIDTGMYPVDWHLHKSAELFVGWLERYGKPLPPGSQRELGDVFLFKFGRTYSHGSIYVEGEGGDLLVHSYIGRGVILSRFNEEPLAGRLVQHWSIVQ